MNALELADELEALLFALGKERPFVKHATMLRQQADRIVELEKALEMKVRYNNLADKALQKRLSDEEITQIALKIGLIVEEQLTEDYAHDYVAEQIEFARAIIKEITE